MTRPRVDAARLNQWITLEAPGAAVPDGDGGYTEQPVPLSPPNDWAAIEPATAANAEQRIASTALAALSHLVTIRWRSDVTLTTQITFVDLAGRTRRLWVRGLQNPQEASELLYLWCEELTAPVVVAALPAEVS